MKNRQIPISRRLLLAAVLGFAIGVLWLAAIRFLTVNNDDVHFHANFALYVDGVRDEFSNFTFYEEVQACTGEHGNDPKSRVHMHNNVNYAVHVHDEGVTWGAFFANLGYGLTDAALETDAGVFTNANGQQLTFILNGEPIDSVANRLISSEDVLLVNYGNENAATLQDRYQEIPRNAAELNTAQDPASCAGAHELTLSDRLRQAFWLSE